MRERNFNPASDASLEAAHRDGASVRQLAKAHGVSSSSVHRAIQRARNEREREAQDKQARAKQRHSSWRARAAKADARPENRRAPAEPEPVEPEAKPAKGKLVSSKRRAKASTKAPTVDDRWESYSLADWLDERDVRAGRKPPAERRERPQIRVVVCGPSGAEQAYG